MRGGNDQTPLSTYWPTVLHDHGWPDKVLLAMSKHLLAILSDQDRVTFVTDAVEYWCYDRPDNAWTHTRDGIKQGVYRGCQGHKHALAFWEAIP